MPGLLHHCGVMAMSWPLSLAASSRLAARFLRNPARYCRKVDRSAAEFPDPLPGMRHVTVDSGGIKLHVATHGLGSELPLMVLLHGFPQTWACWRHQLRAFAGRYELAALDMRGYGDSDAPKGMRAYTVDKLAADVAAVVAALGHTKCILVGHDWGGCVAWNTAALYPQLVERLVVVCCPHPAAYRDPSRFDSKQIQRSSYMFFFLAGSVPEAWLRHADFRELERVFTAAPFGAAPGTFTQEDVERYKAALARRGALTAAVDYYRASMRCTSLWTLPDVEKVYATTITAPTLLLWADGDGAFLPQMYMGTERHVQSLVLHRLEGCSHWAMEERPEEVNGAISAFLSSKAGQRAGTPATAPASARGPEAATIKAAYASGGSRTGTPRLVAKHAD